VRDYLWGCAVTSLGVMCIATHDNSGDM